MYDNLGLTREERVVLISHYITMNYGLSIKEELLYRCIRNNADEDTLMLELTKQELSEMLGCTKETCRKYIKILVDKGVLFIMYNSIYAREEDQDLFDSNANTYILKAELEELSKKENSKTKNFTQESLENLNKLIICWNLDQVLRKEATGIYGRCENEPYLEEKLKDEILDIEGRIEDNWLVLKDCFKRHRMISTGYDFTESFIREHSLRGLLKILEDDGAKNPICVDNRNGISFLLFWIQWRQSSELKLKIFKHNLLGCKVFISVLSTENKEVGRKILDFLEEYTSLKGIEEIIIKSGLEEEMIGLCQEHGYEYVSSTEHIIDDKEYKLEDYVWKKA